MKQITSIFTVFLLVLAAQLALAETERFEAGIGTGKSNVISSSDFKNAAVSGDAHSYWLGYGLDDNWGLEVGLDHFDFDQVSTDHEAMSASAVYRFMPNSTIHPIAKLGAGTVLTKSANGVKINSFGAKVAAGAEVDFKYVSFGVGVNYHYIARIGDTDALKGAQVYVPMLSITIHNDITAQSFTGAGESDSE
ncbi:MAG: outer membrane beta-barrel protein [Bdellovibrio sp.]|nr:outer membrane beta-barrel protein [Bdellovibrio sp.]